MDISVVIPARDKRGYIGMTLKALQDQDFPQSQREIIVVDNGSVDGTADAVSKYFPEVQIFYEPVEGTNPARERGRREAKGDIIAFLDADTIPPPWWLGRGFEYFKNPDIVAVTGPYSFYDGRMRDHIFAYFQRWYFFPLAKKVAEKSGGSLFFFANVLIRKSALKSIDGLDTSLVYHGDDADTAWRLAPHGRILYAQDMCVRTSDRFMHGLIKTVWSDYRSARAIARKHQERYARAHTV